MKSLYIFFVIGFGAMTFSACQTNLAVQSRSLYDLSEKLDSNSINGFTASNIYKDDYDKSVWVSPEAQCVQMSSEKINVFSGSGSLKITWDKIKGGCKWIGVGFGWNNWMSKDILDIAQVSAIQMKIKSVSGSFKNLPVAFALEDYNGLQCYYGYQAGLSSSDFNDSTWTTVSVPLKLFNLESKGFDLEKVKQFIIQLEGDGNIYLDDIKFVRIQDAK